MSGSLPNQSANSKPQPLWQACQQELRTSRQTIMVNTPQCYNVSHDGAGQLVATQDNYNRLTTLAYIHDAGQSFEQHHHTN
jgi:hypothetical protein